MKIIGKAGDDHYLVQISEEEIAISMGFRGVHDDAYKAAKPKPGYNDGGGLKIGTTVNVKAKADAVNSLAWKERTALEGADALEALAKLLRGAMPSRFFTPPEPAAEEAP